MRLRGATVVTESSGFFAPSTELPLFRPSVARARAHPHAHAPLERARAHTHPHSSLAHPRPGCARRAKGHADEGGTAGAIVSYNGVQQITEHYGSTTVSSSGLSLIDGAGRQG